MISNGMQAQPVNFIANYISNSFFEAVQQFQQTVQGCLTKFGINLNFDKFQKTPDAQMSPKKYSISNNQNGYNSVQFIVLRAIHLQCVSFLLVVQRLTSQCYQCLIVTSIKNANQRWKTQIGLNMRISIKINQTVQKPQLTNKLRVCSAKRENIVIQPMSRKWKYVYQDIKNKGNQYFNAKDYMNALLYYQYALSCSQLNQDREARSILYANAAACFLQMKLYDQTIRYADLSIKIDKNYVKGYFRKFKALLQQQKFQQSLHLLIECIPHIDVDTLTKLNDKYTIYVANTLGIYNWSQIFQTQNQQLAFSDYLSPKLQFNTFGNSKYYSTKDKIQSNQIILIKKSLFYIKNKPSLNQQQIVRQIQMYKIFQQSFNQAINKVPQLQKPKLSPPQQNGKKAYSHQSMTKSNCKKNCIMPAQQIQKYKSADIKGYGIWIDFSYFEHDCQPNCSYFHLKTALCVCTTKTIQKNTKLSIDFAAYEPPLKRKKYLKQRFNIECDCRACQWKQWPKITSSFSDMMGVLKQLGNILMIKQLLWQIIMDQQAFQHNYGKQQLIYNDAVQKYIKVLSMETHWVDILKLLELLRQDQIFHVKSIIWEAVTDKFSQFFKVDKPQCHQLVKYVL